MRHSLLFTSLCLFVGLALLPFASARAEEAAPKRSQLTMVVMDPLAAPLSCPCVEGYAQREYEALQAYLEKKLGRSVQLFFVPALSELKKEGITLNSVDLIIGKDSVVRYDGKKYELDVTGLARLTDKTGSTTQYGMIVVPKDDPAQEPKDLVGYNVIFGDVDAQEKHQAAIDLLTAAGVKLPEKLEVSPACSDGACKILELDGKSAAVISSYAAPLLEGCGTIKKGDLRVVGKTKEVPFVTAFATGKLTAAEQQELRAALGDVVKDPELCGKLESLIGFTPIEADDVKKKVSVKLTPAWNQWRGPDRDGRYPELPATLPAEPALAWKVDLASGGLGGIAADDKLVVIGYRDFDDFQDVFQCFDAATGESLWQLEYLAIGALDYGLSSRATPCLVGDKAILLGALGDLHCVKLADGEVVWKTNLRSQFEVSAEMPWGFCGSPLIVGDKVIVQAGGAEASLVALNLADGSIAWKSPGAAPSYGSLIIAELGGKQLIVGHDVKSLNGWDVETGRRLWSVQPQYEGDFNVPTPLVVDGKLLVVTENNGARLFDFQNDGMINPKPVMENPKLKPDMSSPVVVGQRVFCVNKFLYCLDLKNNLAETYRQRDKALGDYGAIIADQDRLLVIGDGDLLLVDAKSDEFHLIARMKFSTEKTEIFSHPALVGNRLYLRDEATIYCWTL